MPKPKKHTAAKQHATPGEDPAVLKRLEALGLERGHDGLVPIQLLRTASGKGYSYAEHEQPRCEPGRAIVLVFRGYAQPAPAQA
jgi:hypothetical protein